MSAAYDPGMHMSPQEPQPQQNLAYAHGDIASNASAPVMSAPKRKRGRPCKHDPRVAMPLATIPAPYQVVYPCGVGLVSSQALPALPSPLPPLPPSENATQRANKKRRKVTTAGSGVIGLNPEIITIQVGEDVARKVMSFSRNGWAVCVMSAHGVVSNVTLCQGASPYEAIIYEGCFEILSLSGSYQQSESNGMCIRKGGLGVSLAGPGGRVFGGVVTGPLTAASTVQVVIGRFPVDEKKKIKRAATTGGIEGASGSTPRGALNGSL